jgi:cytochrome c5
MYKNCYPYLSKKVVPLFFLCTISGAATHAEQSDVIAGKEVYENYCAACHEPTNVMVASPKKGDSEEWTRRLSKGSETLLSSIVSGYNAMPARGNCDRCSDVQLIAAMRYLAGVTNLKAPD